MGNMLDCHTGELRDAAPFSQTAWDPVLTQNVYPAHTKLLHCLVYQIAGLARCTPSYSASGACSTSARDHFWLAGSLTARRVASQNSPSSPPDCCGSASGWWRASPI